ncbi:MAG: biotin-dependent carboxyltransferase family protein [Sporomusaceae bacterium]|nr:biotin-dependent carboxyltransferase family protein [Sporomusaceae bacterium]
MITVRKPGLLSTIQDKGRFGYQAFGMPVAGAMDDYAAAAANALLDNDANAAVLEMTFFGGEFEFKEELCIAIAGADMQASLNGSPVANWSSFLVPANSILSFGAVTKGCRTYLAVPGGFDVPLVMGSRSTYTRAKIGGVSGRALAAADQLSACSKDKKAKVRQVPETWLPVYKEVTEIRVLLGPQDDLFTPEGTKTFLSEVYTLSNEADRMGFRFEGAKIEHCSGADIVSDALAFGSIQIPGHGSPIIMMADRQTTGGYTKMATVIRADRTKLAQLKPGDKVKFAVCSEQTALKAYSEQDERVKRIYELPLASSEKVATTQSLVEPSGKPRQFVITVNDHQYDVQIVETSEK